MTATLKLKGRIAEKGYTLERLSKEIGLSRTSFSYKLNNKRTFTVKEIVEICRILGISKKKDEYFFV